MVSQSYRIVTCYGRHGDVKIKVGLHFVWIQYQSVDLIEINVNN